MFKEITLNYPMAKVIELFSNNKFENMLNDVYSLDFSFNNDNLIVSTDSTEVRDKMANLFNALIYIKSKNITLENKDIHYIMKMHKIDKLDDVVDLYVNRTKILTTKNRVIYCKTLTQKEYLSSIEKNDIVFAIGPAGTGKTFIAVLDAVRRLKDKSIKKIILTRPAVEAGESLGFLPGELKDKIDPYLIPLYDALYESMDYRQVEELIEEQIIEIAPLAYMRGRTLDNSLVILDEAQNTSEKQMKMFLTRLGANSKMIISGDISQVDLPLKTTSGLLIATKILKDIKGIKIIEFNNDEVVRHPLVKKILSRYDEYENRN